MRATFTAVSPTLGRRRSAHRRISAGGNGDADNGEAENQLIVILAADVAAALAHRIADIAEYEQVAEGRAGKPGHVLRLAGDQPAGKAARGGAGGVGVVDRRFHSLPEFWRQSRAAIVGQIDKALGEIGVAGIERRLDLMDRDGAVKGAREAAVGNRRGIVRR